MAPLAASDGDILCFCMCSVFVFFSSGATAQQQLLGRFSPNLHQQMSLLFVNHGTAMKISPSPKNGSKRPFLKQKFSLCRLWMETRRKSGKT